MASRNAYGKGFGRGFEKGVIETTDKLKSEKGKTATVTGVIGLVVGALLTVIFKPNK